MFIVLYFVCSRQYGYLLLHASENAKKKALVVKVTQLSNVAINKVNTNLLLQAVKYLQLMVVQAKQQQKVQNENDAQNGNTKKISIDPKTWVKLGHFHLLLEEYRKGMHIYAKSRT